MVKIMKRTHKNFVNSTARALLMDMNQHLFKYLQHLDGELFRSSRSWGQRSRSSSNGHRNLVNTIACKPLKDLTQNLHTYLLHLRDEPISFQGHRVKGHSHTGTPVEIL